ncbi:hypothetical protein AAF712_014640 [Marasmius tenuissimus]|uniref:HMG box domain-containing protein n=1 Tax=Marasmius tenuissimus TaxID=585030 RepID=A0ABR2ZBP4_9AGAR
MSTADGVKSTSRTNAIAAKYATAVAPASLMTKRTRNTKSKRAPLTRAEQERRRQARQMSNDQIRQQMAGLRRKVRHEFVVLGKEHKKDPKYFSDMFFQGGVRIGKPPREPSSFNVFVSEKAQTLRKAGGPAMTVQQIQKLFKDEYRNQTPAERKKMMKSFQERRDLDARERLKRPSVKEKIADASSSIGQVAGVLKGLKMRVGVEAMVLVVKNRPEKIMKPQWIFTDDRIRRYLPTIMRGWDTARVGKKVEALAVAGCDPTKLIKNTKDQANALKKECTQLIQDTLGWPKGLPFQKMSSFGGSTDPLFILRDAWRDGDAKFRKLDEEEFEAWKDNRVKGIQDGSIVLKPRKKRRDAGQKRGKNNKSKSGKEEIEDGEDEDEDEDEEGDKGDNNNEEEEWGGISVELDMGMNDTTVRAYQLFSSFLVVAHCFKDESTPTPTSIPKTKKANSSAPKTTKTSSQSRRRANAKQVAPVPHGNDNEPEQPDSDSGSTHEPSPAAPPRPKPQRKPTAKEREQIAQGVGDASFAATGDAAGTTESPSSGMVTSDHSILVGQSIDPQLLNVATKSSQSPGSAVSVAADSRADVTTTHGPSNPDTPNTSNTLTPHPNSALSSAATTEALTTEATESKKRKRAGEKPRMEPTVEPEGRPRRNRLPSRRALEGGAC